MHPDRRCGVWHRHRPLFTVAVASSRAMSLLPFGGGGRAPPGLRVNEAKHPSRGGNPYGQDMRTLVLALHEREGLDHIKND